MGIYLLCIIIWLVEQISSKTATASILFIDKQLYIEFFIPQKNESLHTQINQQVLFSWFNNKFIKSTQMHSALLSQEEKNLIINPIKSIITGKIAENTFKIENSTYNSFSYYEIELNEETERSLSNGLTFSYLVDDISFSFVYTLYHNKLIDKLQYSIIPNKFTIYFGELPQDIISNQNRVKCDIINNRWGCLLKKIYLSNDESIAYENTNIEALFQAHEVNFYVSEKFLLFFINTVNHKLSQNAQCLIEGGNDERYVSCQITAFKFIKNVTFVIGDSSIHFPIESLFSCSEYGCFSYFHYSKRYDYLGKNVWVFGTAFILNFNSVYDYSDKSILLYSKSVAITSNTKEIQLIKDMTMVIIIMLIAMMILNIYVKIINKK